MRMIERLQAQRARFPILKALDLYGDLGKAISELVPPQHWDSDAYLRVMKMVRDYAEFRQQISFWDGVIEGHINMVEAKLDRLEYAQAAVAAGQDDLLNPDPDDIRSNPRVEAGGTG